VFFLCSRDILSRLRKQDYITLISTEGQMLGGEQEYNHDNSDLITLVVYIQLELSAGLSES
jgi:hypothetical protein